MEIGNKRKRIKCFHQILKTEKEYVSKLEIIVKVLIIIFL